MTVTRSSNKSRVAFADALDARSGGGISESNALRRVSSTRARNCAPSSAAEAAERVDERDDEPFFAFFAISATSVAAARSFSADSAKVDSTLRPAMSRMDSLPSVVAWCSAAAQASSVRRPECARKISVTMPASSSNAFSLCRSE